MPTSTDRIEKQIFIHAPRTRVWRALTDAREFGQWFGVRLEGPFAAGARVTGRITHAGYDHLTMAIEIDRVEPERLFAWRWHPGAFDPAVDDADEPMTTVVFELHDEPGGTRLTVVESGFDAIPLARRVAALRLNTEGWAEQLENITHHVRAAA